jgi:hypothetical protein
MRLMSWRVQILEEKKTTRLIVYRVKTKLWQLSEGCKMNCFLYEPSCLFFKKVVVAKIAAAALIITIFLKQGVNLPVIFKKLSLFNIVDLHHEH